MNNLLQQGDFHIFSFNKKKYVFLSGSQQILEISNMYSTFRLLRNAKTRHADTECNAWLQHVLQILFCFDPARQKKRDVPFGSPKRNCQHA